MAQPTFRETAHEVLRQMQKRDYRELDLQMDAAKDEVIKDLTFGRLALQIPSEHYEVLTMIYPDLQCADNEIKTLAWKKFMQQPESLPYKPNKKLRSM